jgi:hypothetical protein
MQYKYNDGSIGGARDTAFNGHVYPASCLAQKNGESDSAWLARLATIGVAPVRTVMPDVSINTHDLGHPAEDYRDGWVEVTYPAPVPKVPVWNTANQELMYIAEGTAVPDGYTDQAPPDKWAKWDRGSWSIDTTAARRAKRREIIANADATMAALTTSYSDHEKLSWAKQEAEAHALTADPDAAAPLLRGIAAARGIDLADLVTRVLANVASYETASAAVLGQQQRYEDMLTAAGDDADAILAITPTYTLPE